MKKHLLILLFNVGLLATTISFSTAQPVLTKTGIAYTPGDVISTITNYGHYLNPGNSGINQTWDLTVMGDSGTSSTSVVAASSLPISDSFPAATIALITGGYYLFYNTSSSAMQYLGEANGSNVDFEYVNPEDQLRFPFSYSNTYTDPWRESSFLYGTPRFLSGTTTVTADGYGTAITPNHTYSNAMRVHFIENYYDSVYVGTWYVHTWNLDSYRWYVNGIHNPVAEIDSTSIYYLGVFGGSNYSGSYLNSVPCTPTSSSSSDTVCNNYIWNGTTFITSGTYTFDASPNATGCDSTATLNLTINISSSGSSSALACNSYVWNGITYTASTVFISHFTNATGCDSTAALNLTISGDLPVAAASSNVPIYTGSTLLLSASGGINYLWTGPNSFTSTQQSPIITNASSVNAGTYTVIVANGCGNSSSSTSVTVLTALVPTLNEWGLIAFSVLVLGAGVLFVSGRMS